MLFAAPKAHPAGLELRLLDFERFLRKLGWVQRNPEVQFE